MEMTFDRDYIAKAIAEKVKKDYKIDVEEGDITFQAQSVGVMPDGGVDYYQDLNAQVPVAY